ncbi:YiiX/YebB-like N1pC/P60 family cysteine hydrolase [Pseudomonas anguilliseptica]|uniref:Permuted papain-like amidase enzyme, YaeF/YiiX, C92 family n=1 Tax=Pseudomonas anguilliseptica TaxID=53406 RepID=A0A1H5BA37_PSEAG|nr:YiiX/YebB-like N1pC/P60 family cysteine hydrolase [Pseudomonas anguilliseptica]SED51101.1 Permuted papain-like amidase enzyme, YaeF/YiiX, C92 family [Pseudomonas anguilliseptica]
MGSIQLLFSTTHHPFSGLIRAATWSDWSHVALVAGNYVIEAVALEGVRQVSKAYAIERASAYSLVDMPARNPQAIIDAARSQIGKPYDWTAIAGLGLHRDWQEEDSWFCSELLAWAADQAGEPWFRPEALRRITPQHIWMLSPERGLCHIEG